MKEPVKPTAPKKPLEPKAPEEFHCYYSQIYLKNGKASLAELIAQLPAGSSPEDLIFEEDYFSINEYDDGETAFHIRCKQKAKDPNFKSLQKKYEKLKSEYPDKITKYNLDLIAYEEKLIKYNKDLELYKLAKAKSDLRKAQRNLSKLTSKK